MNKILKYLTLKNTVAVTLVACGVLSVLILFTGLVFGSATLDKLSDKSSVNSANPDASLASAGLEGNGDGQAENANQNSDGTNSGGTPTSSSPNSTTSNTGSSAGSSAGSTSSGTKTGTTSGGSSGGTSSGGAGTPASASISSFTASPSSISYNSASTLSWASSNATSCSISTLGTVGTSGTKSTGNLTSSKSYTLTCGTATKQATVSVGSPPVACGQSGGVCTSAQVAAHASQGDCWMIYNGYYYIVTAYVNNHPGGRGVFNTSSCGRDISGYMNGSASTGGKQHSHSSGAYSVLNSYRIGQVQG